MQPSEKTPSREREFGKAKKEEGLARTDREGPKTQRAEWLLSIEKDIVG